MKKRTLFLLASLSFLLTRSRRKARCKNSQVKPTPENLWTDYDFYREISLTNRFIKHSSILPLLRKLETSHHLKQEVIGYSVEGRSIHHLSWGSGKVKVLLWSQMHGDESTATMALFDILNFLTATDKYDNLRAQWYQELELHFVPLLNPDGAERWTRRNAMEIDINRDARDLVTPEGNLLKVLWDKVKPHIGFNLHDQSIQYAAGLTNHPATISFLAPAYNYNKDINEVRERAMLMISFLNQILQPHIPKQIGKFNDDHDPRCFGDNFQAWGTSTVLLESGGYAGDPEKQFIRKLNFYALVNAFQTIVTNSYLTEKLAGYNDIPGNSRTLFDLVLRQVTIRKGGISFRANLGITRTVKKSLTSLSAFYQSTIEEMGDLSYHYGYEELDVSGYTVEMGKTLLLTKDEGAALSLEASFALLQAGYLFMQWTDKKPEQGPELNSLLTLIPDAADLPEEIGPESPATFMLAFQGQPRYAIINGFCLDLTQPPIMISNTWFA